MGGRLILIKYVLNSIPLHILSTISPPKQTLHEIERLYAKFFWGQFDRMIRGIRCFGLDFVVLWRKMVLASLPFIISQQPFPINFGGFIVLVILFGPGLYVQSMGILLIFGLMGSLSIWLLTIGVVCLVFGKKLSRILVLSFEMGALPSGGKIGHRGVVWLRLSRGFSLSSQHLCVKDVIDYHGWNIPFIKSLESNFQANCLHSIPPHLIHGWDRHVLKLSNNCQFSLSTALQRIVSWGVGNSVTESFWDSHCPIKYSLFMWKLINGFLGSDDVRKRMGFHLFSQCGCNNGEDSLDHIFLHCTSTNYLWRECARLLGMQCFSLISFASVYVCLAS